MIDQYTQASYPWRERDCAECGSGCRELVQAVNVGDQRDPRGHGYAGEYEYVSPERLVVGESWAGEQCGDCGNTAYIVVRTVHNTRAMACTPDPDDEEPSGCGRTSPIVTMQSHCVVF